MKKLNIFELHRAISEKNNRKIECYEKVLDICHKKIVVAAENKKLRIFIEVPEYVCGYPLYNINSCLKFILDSLKANGFLVKYYFPKILYISWDFEEIKGDNKIALAPQQNIQQAMPQNKSSTKQPLFQPKLALTSSLVAKPTPYAMLNRKPTGKLELNMY